jgi:myo-inositol-1(or 4)-monophosphatase
MPTPLEFATELALQTGALLKKYYNPAGLQASRKLDNSVVTEADLAADRLISQSIHEQYPQDEIISEESGSSIKSELSPIWVIDPLDGTTNFSLGLPVWGVSIARLIDGLPQLGVLFFPLINELYIASLGSGATLNHSPIHTREPDPSQPMSFFACCSRSFRNYNISIPYKPRIMGSACYSFCLVARGSALLGFEATPKIWDLAAAWLLVKEAGGTIFAFDGSSPFPVSLNVDYNVTNYPTLAASTSKGFEFGKKNIHRK